MFGSFGIWVLEFMKGVGYMLWHGEVNASWMIIAPIYFDSTVQATSLVNTHRVIFSDGFYDMI